MEYIDNLTYHHTDASTENTMATYESSEQRASIDQPVERSDDQSEARTDDQPYARTDDQPVERSDDQPIYASEVMIKKINDNQRVLTPQQCDQLLNELVGKGCWHPMLAVKFKKSIIKISEMMQLVDKKKKKISEVVSDPNFYSNFNIVYEMMDHVSVSCALEDKCDDMIKNAANPQFNKEIKKKIESTLFLIDMYFPLMLRYADFLDNVAQQRGHAYDMKRNTIHDIDIFKTNLQTYIEKRMSKYSKRSYQQPVQYADVNDNDDCFEYMIILAFFLTIIYIVFAKTYK